MKAKRPIALLTAFAVLFALFFSVIFPSAQASHAHENKDTCTVCATVRECGELCASLSAAVSFEGENAAPKLRVLTRSEGGRRPLFARRATPVSLKVKLID